MHSSCQCLQVQGCHSMHQGVRVFELGRSSPSESVAAWKQCHSYSSGGCSIERAQSEEQEQGFASMLQGVLECSL